MASSWRRVAVMCHPSKNNTVLIVLVERFYQFNPVQHLAMNATRLLNELQPTQNDAHNIAALEGREYRLAPKFTCSSFSYTSKGYPSTYRPIWSVRSRR